MQYLIAIITLMLFAYVWVEAEDALMDWLIKDLFQETEEE